STLVHTGATYTPSPSLTATTTYYVTVEGTGICENAPNNGRAVTVTVTPRGKADFILITGPIAACEGENITLNAVLNPLNPANPAIVNPVFKWYADAALTQLIHTGAELIMTANTVGLNTLYVTVEGDNYCPNAVGTAQTHGITVHEMPIITLPGGQTNYAIPVNSMLDLSTYTVTPTGSTVTWYDETGTEIPTGDV